MNNHRMPRGHEVREVHESELTLAERKAFGLPLLMKVNADLVPTTREDLNETPMKESA